jgi:Ala-tRNA(Pro) deacylase
MSDVIAYLDQISVPYQLFEHEAVFTVAESEKVNHNIPGAATKNLFLTNADESQYWLVVVPAQQRVDLKALETLLGAGKLHFGDPEALQTCLGLTPGSVSICGLVNDVDQRVTLVVDNSFRTESGIHVHPNRNTATLVISADDLVRFVESTTHAVTWISLPYKQ